MSKQHPVSEKCPGNKLASSRLASKPNKIKTVSEDDLAEFWHAVYIFEQLSRIRELLVEQGADEDMLTAIDQALADNDDWLDDDLLFDGNA